MTFTCILILVQAVGILAAVAASAVEIETIVFTGPLLSLVGLLIALLCYRRNCALGFQFGLSVPTAAVLCFSIIYGLKWGPDDAAAPISCLLLVFGILSLPLGLVAFWAMRNTTGSTRRLRIQFQILDLLGLMFLVSLFFGLTKAFSEPGTAVGIVVAYVMVVAYLARCFREGLTSTGATDLTSHIGRTTSNTGGDLS